MESAATLMNDAWLATPTPKRKSMSKLFSWCLPTHAHKSVHMSNAALERSARRSKCRQSLGNRKGEQAQRGWQECCRTETSWREAPPRGWNSGNPLDRVNTAHPKKTAGLDTQGRLHFHRFISSIADSPTRPHCQGHRLPSLELNCCASLNKTTGLMTAEGFVMSNR